MGVTYEVRKKKSWSEAEKSVERKFEQHPKSRKYTTNPRIMFEWDRPAADHLVP